MFEDKTYEPRELAPTIIQMDERVYQKNLVNSKINGSSYGYQEALKVIDVHLEKGFPIEGIDDKLL